MIATHLIRPIAAVLALACALSTAPALAQVQPSTALNANIAATAAALGAPADAEAASGNGTMVALSKAQRTILANLLASYGASADAAAAATGANGSMIALTKALRDRLNGTLTVGLSGALPAGTNAIGSVLADLRVAGAAVAAGNPVPVSGTIALGAGAASIGSIANTAFAISGTLPAFAATPTFNLGTLNGAATAANQASEIAALGAPADAAYAGTGSASLIAALKGIYSAAALSARPAVASTTALAANATVTGTYFSGMGADGTFPYPFAYFTCSAFADQAGTLYVEASIDNATFFPRNGTAGTAVAAGGSAEVKVALSANVMRCRYVNGGTAQTKFFLASVPSRS